MSKYSVTEQSRGMRYHNELPFVIVRQSDECSEVIAAFHGRVYAERFAGSMNDAFIKANQVSPVTNPASAGPTSTNEVKNAE